MSTADRAAFLAAIRENPEDDLPRLIYADWLDEHGEPERAEFIRLQCELARLPRHGLNYAKLEDRERELLMAQGERWRRAELPKSHWIAWGPFVRGFIDEVQIDHFQQDIFAQVRDRLPIRKLSIRSMRPNDFQALARSPILTRLTALHASSGQIGNVGVRSLVNSPYLGRLSHLNLSRNQIGDAGAQLLAESPRLADLQTLILAENVIRDTGAEALAASPHWDTLTQLDLRRNLIGAETRNLLRARFRATIKF